MHSHLSYKEQKAENIFFIIIIFNQKEKKRFLLFNFHIYLLIT